MKEFVILTLLWLPFSCSVPKKGSVGGKSFCFNDSYYRNIKLTFHRDSSYSLANETTMALAFSSSGTWKVLGKNMVQLRSNANVSDSGLKNAPLTGHKIDLEKAGVDKSYIFPAISLDTFYLKEDSYVLKGYIFKKCQ